MGEKATTFAEYAARWLENRTAAGYRTVKDSKYHLDRINEVFGAQPISSIRPPHVRAWVQRLRAGDLAPRTVRNYVGTLLHVLRDAAADELIPERRWLKRGDLPPQVDSDPTFRQRCFVTAEEAAALI